VSDLRVGQPSVAGVADPQAQAVLQHILDLLNVRQGFTGDGEEQFITRKMLRDQGVAIERLGDGKGALASAADAGSVRNRLESLLGTNIQSIQDAIAGSPSFQLLGDPVQPLAGGGAQIAEVRRTMNNQFASFAQLSTTLQAQIGQQRVTVIQNAEAVADLDGRVRAQYYVKIDNNGHVSGFGLFSTANNGAAISEFYVRADRFAIGAPGVPRATNPDGSFQAAAQAEIPFVVFTTPTVIDGKTVLPGVYMRRTFIHDGAIVNAMIGNAAVNTIEIAGNAVTVPVSANQSGTVTLSPTWQTVVSASITYDAASVPPNTVIIANGYTSAVAGSNYHSVLGRIVIDGVPYFDFGISVKTQDAGSALPTLQLVSDSVLGAGSHTVEYQVSIPESITGYPGFTKASILLLGAKR